jgi:hypothetical protein
MKFILLSLERNQYGMWDAMLQDQAQSHAIGRSEETPGKAIQGVVQSLLISTQGRDLLTTISNEPLPDTLA